jgi:hypothetical protein
MTIGLTWRRTARRIKRLKEGVLTISPDYSDRDPGFLGALPTLIENRLHRLGTRLMIMTMVGPSVPGIRISVIRFFLVFGRTSR